MSKFRIAWMFPDTLFLHGERGNVLALKRFAEIAGLDSEVVKIDFDSKGFDPMDYQVMFFAPGEISSFPAVIEWLDAYRDKIREYIESGRVMIVTGTSVGIFGKEIKRDNGETIQGLDLIDIGFNENKAVYGDDLYYSATYNCKDFEIIGNQIQMGDIDLGTAEAFGHVIYGYGNCGKDLNEGIKLNNSVFTNTLGPMLVCNPRITAEIIKVAAASSGLKADESALDNYDDSLERKSFETKKKFTENKESNLTNCTKG